MITTQQRVTGAKTIGSPAVVAQRDKYVLAWIGVDATVWWTTLGLNQHKDGYDTTELASTGFSTQPFGAPALANLGSTVWMAWLQDPAQAALIPPYNTQRKPPVILVSRLEGTTWSSPQPVWDPGPLGSGDWQQGLPSSGAISAPAFAATGSELLLVWCEYAMSGSDAPVIPTPEGLPITGPIESQIYFSKWSQSTGWTKRSAVPGALTQATPALVAFNGVVSMAWKGQFDSHVYFAQYTDHHGWIATAKLQNIESSAGPALGAGKTGNIHLAWKDAFDDDIWTGFLAAGTAWTPHHPNHGWSSHTKIPVIATSMSPALASQSSDDTDLLLAWAGASAGKDGASDVFVGPLDALASRQSQKYAFTIGNVWIVTQRSGDLESDTDYLALAVAIGSKPVVSTSMYLGDHSYGDVLEVFLRIESDIADDERVIMTYIMYNHGFDPLGLPQNLVSWAEIIAQTALAAYTGNAETSELNISLPGGPVMVPTSGSALTALGGLLSGLNVPAVYPTCDGPVAAGVHAFTGAKLRQGGNGAIDKCVGINSPDGCGNNSLYDVGWSVSVA